MKTIRTGIKALLICIIAVVSSMNVWAAGKNATDIKQVELNGIRKTIPEGTITREGQVFSPFKGEKIIRKEVILLPLKWLALEMGATHVEWNEKKHTVTVEVPAYSEEHQYLSYLAGIEYGKNKNDFPLAKRLQDFELPPYPLNSDRPTMLHQTPIGITIADDGFKIRFVAYDYEMVNGKLYVGSDWFNTMFLAQTEVADNLVKIVYPTETEIKEKLAKLEEITAPVTQEETLALWITGQQGRSGSLQYSALSPELKAKVLARKTGWVTGGSSPSAGKATITHKEEIDEKTTRYIIEIEELSQGKVSAIVKETIEMKKYEIKGHTYWLISSVKDDTSYFSLLPDR